MLCTGAAEFNHQTQSVSAIFPIFFLPSRLFIYFNYFITVYLLQKVLLLLPDITKYEGKNLKFLFAAVPFMENNISSKFSKTSSLSRFRLVKQKWIWSTQCRKNFLTRYTQRTRASSNRINSHPQKACAFPSTAWGVVWEFIVCMRNYIEYEQPNPCQCRGKGTCTYLWALSPDP